jgi:hypothetical protein
MLLLSSSTGTEEGARKAICPAECTDPPRPPPPSFLLTSVYHYGTDTASRWRSLPSFVAPSLFEDRVSDLFVPYISAMSSSLPQHRSPTLPPVRSRLDLVIFSSGFWDLAAWAREDIKAGSSATSDLSESRLLEWRARSVDMVAALAKAWPKTSLAWRSSQIPSSSEPATVEWWTGELGEGEQVGSCPPPPYPRPRDLSSPHPPPHLTPFVFPPFSLSRSQRIILSSLSTVSRHSRTPAAPSLSRTATTWRKGCVIVPHASLGE